MKLLIGYNAVMQYVPIFPYLEQSDRYVRSGLAVAFPERAAEERLHEAVFADQAAESSATAANTTVCD